MTNLGSRLCSAFAWLALSLPLAAQGSELLVLNKTDATLSFVDAVDGTTRAVIGTGVGPHELAVEPGGKRAVVCNYGAAIPGSSLTLIDLERRLPLATIDLGEHRRPHGIAFRGPGLAIVTCEASNALIEIDVDQRKVLRAFPTDQKYAHMVVLSPDGKRAYAANIGSGSVSAFDLEAGKLVASASTGAGAEGIAITPDGKELWVANRSADTLCVVDSADLSIRATLECASFPIRVQITPDGARALVSNAKSGEVAVFDVATRKAVARVPLAVTALERGQGRMFAEQFDGSPVPVGILIDPSGKRAFVANTNADVVSVLDLENLTLSGRLRAGREPDGLAWWAR